MSNDITTHLAADLAFGSPANQVSPATPASTSSTSVQRVRHLVVDSGAIITGVRLHELAENLWTVPDVISEIRDKRARHVLASLPQQLVQREPSQEAISFIINFSRCTGDYRSVSNADIKVLALCYDLEREQNGTSHLNTLPYRELHTSDENGETLFVCKQTHRKQPPPGTSLNAVMNAIRDVLTDQYKIEKKNTVGMKNKFHRSAVLAMVKKYTDSETIGILEQYRRELIAQGPLKGISRKHFGQWFSGQLKLISQQLKQEQAEKSKSQKNTTRQHDDHAGNNITPPRAEKSMSAATMRAIARTRRAKAVGESKSTIAKRAPGNPWSKGLAESINSTTTSVIDDEEFPKMETTNQSLTQVGVGTTVGIHMNVGCDKMHGPCPYFACGRVVALKSNAQRDVIAKVSLGWQLADGQPPLMFVPVNDLTPLAESHAPEFKTTPSSHIEASSNTGSSLSQRKPDVDAKTCNPVSQATAASTKSKILSISGGGLSSTQYVDADDDNENDWVTPDNIGGFLGQEGFTKAYQTVTSKISVGCITMDFAMQNVLLQIGLNLVSAGGHQIQRVRQWVLYCNACFHEMRDMERLFCARCGSAGVSKLAVSLSRQGKLRRHFSTRRKVKLTGERYSLPKPRGGRTLDLLLREDQLLTGGWKQKANRKVLNHSFMGQHVLGSLGMRIGVGTDVVVGMGRRNPNAMKGRERRGQKMKSRRGKGRNRK